ncbi:hypothetical protein B9Z55_001611 [Caenorhabditis nigoni]|uniref:Uncharacterized protein n=1 Tax=Caenorhabditis nigoni TaxID=1611254 RepID=A0A2G5VGL7_9PELO|nr:hypothetical protein B9Z55_001611 [Caenorhabditis nigoni]
MSRCRSHPAKSGRVLACGLEGVQMPSYTGQSSRVIGKRKEVNSPIQSSEGSMMSPIQCPVVRQFTKNSDKLITRPQEARDQRLCAQSNQGITQVQRADRHCYPGDEEDNSVAESSAQPDPVASPKATPATQSRGTPKGSKNKKKSGGDDSIQKPSSSEAPLKESQEGEEVVHAKSCISAKNIYNAKYNDSAMYNDSDTHNDKPSTSTKPKPSTSAKPSTATEPRTTTKAYGLTLAKLYSRSMPEGNNSRRAKLPQESASLTSAHSLAHQSMRSTERCSTGPAPKESHHPPTMSRHTLS